MDTSLRIDELGMGTKFGLTVELYHYAIKIPFSS